MLTGGFLLARAVERYCPRGHCKAGDRPLRPWSTMNQPGQGRCCRMKDDDAGVNHESAHRNRSSARSSALSLCWRPSRAWRMASAGWRGTTALARAASVREADGVGQADGPGRPGWATTPVYPARDPSKTRSDHRAKKARERCVGLSAISSLLQKGDSRVMSLGHPSYPRPKGTRNHSMAEKRGYVEIGETGPRKTRVAWSKLDRLNPNPDRGLSYSVVRPIEHDVIECRPFPFRGYGKPAR